MFVLFVAASWFSSYFIDWLWFENLGFSSVFWRSLGARWTIGLLGGLVFGGAVFANLFLATRDAPLLPPNVIPFPYQRWLRPRGLTLLVALAGAFLGAMAGLALSKEWLTFLLYGNQTSFATPDPLFGKDVSFYVFRLPVLVMVHQFLSAAIVLSLFAAGAVYALTGRVAFEGRWLNMHPRARMHLSALLGAFLLFKSWGYWLDTYRLLFSPRGVAFGAGYTDIYAQLPGLRFLAVLAAVVGILALSNIWIRNYKLFLGGLAALVLASFALGSVVPGVMQNLVVKPNEIVKETRFIRQNIKYTRQAYNLDRIKEQDFPAATSLTAADLPAEQGTLGNIRLWDLTVLRSAFQQLQAIRQYYHFDDVDIDRYTIDGLQRQVVLSAREISYTDLPGKSWINQHIKYTHGYGAVVSPASAVTREGQPDLWVKNIPPSTTVSGGDAVTIEEPRIYFGEQMDTYAIVGTQEQEFDFPKGDENSYTRYQGRGGIPVGGLVQRVAFALRTGDYNLLFSRALTPDSRALIYRRVQERVDRIAPFLLYDRDPYLVVADGRLFWIQDAYTITGAYPYSDPTNMEGGIRFNYIRNSVKAVVDAYNGDVSFYVADDTDPLIRSFQKVFPGLFRPLAEMDEVLRQHLRYPEGLFVVQAEKYAIYHMQDPAVFYNKEDTWVRPREKVGTTTDPTTMDPYFVVMQLPGESRPEFLLMMPYAPKGRQNMIAWLAARSDGEHYGDLLVYKFPKQSLVYGPEQVEALIDQNDAIAEKLTLWNQQGSRVIRGNLLVIPVRDSLLYVEPIYLQSTSTRFPELRRVVAVYGNRPVMADSLDQALASLFSGNPLPVPDGGIAAPSTPAIPGEDTAVPSGEPGAVVGIDALIEEATRLYREAQDALRLGDWSGYGDRIERLGRVLSQMQGAKP